jgi:uncharacterized protein (TIGR02118 family)
MITVTFLYPNTPGGRFDADYYIDMHMPLAIRLLGPALKAVTAEIGTSAAMPDQPPPFFAMARFTFESVQAFTEAVMPHYIELQSDIPNYTDVAPVVQVGDLRISQ